MLEDVILFCLPDSRKDSKLSNKSRFVYSYAFDSVPYGLFLKGEISEFHWKVTICILLFAFWTMKFLESRLDFSLASIKLYEPMPEHKS